MYGNTWCLTKIGAKLLLVFVIFPLFSSDIPSDFQELIGVVPLKYLFYF